VPTQMVVMWATEDNTDTSTVEYWLGDDGPHLTATGTYDHYVFPLFYESPALHSVLLLFSLSFFLSVYFFFFFLFQRWFWMIWSLEVCTTISVETKKVDGAQFFSLKRNQSMIPPRPSLPSHVKLQQQKQKRQVQVHLNQPTENSNCGPRR
jgi:hypothetical protein